MHSQSTQRSFFIRFQRSRAWSWIKPASSFTLELQVSDLRWSVSKAEAMEGVSSCSRAERSTQRMWRGYRWAVLLWENTKKKPDPSTTAESCHPDRWGWCKTPSNSMSNLTLALKCTLFQVSFSTTVSFYNVEAERCWLSVQPYVCLCFSSRASQKQRRGDMYCEDSRDSGRKCSEGECRGSRKCGVSLH